MPNIFDYATSELSQDAVIAYILTWAKPEYRETNRDLNQLGRSLLWKLLEVSAEAKGIENPLKDEELFMLEVGTQRDHIDIWAEINDKYFLLIEDKTFTKEHSHQIKHYCDKARTYKTESKNQFEVFPIYLKTGNESCHVPDKNEPYGLFYRPHLLEVLKKYPETENTIIAEFHQHLKRFEEETNSFLEKPIEEWSPRAIEGYYLALEKWIASLYKDSKFESCKAFHGWGYVPNQSGGFLGFWLHWCKIPKMKCQLYLQVNDAKELKIRICDIDYFEAGKHMLYNKQIRNVYNELIPKAKELRSSGINIDKKNRYRKGETCGLANVEFDNSDTYIATDDNGKVDLELTKKRLHTIMNIIDSFCIETESKI